MTVLHFLFTLLTSWGAWALLRDAWGFWALGLIGVYSLWMGWMEPKHSRYLGEIWRRKMK